jgi:hypothetical protein
MSRTQLLPHLRKFRARTRQDQDKQDFHDLHDKGQHLVLKVVNVLDVLVLLDRPKVESSTTLGGWGDRPQTLLPTAG